MVVHDICQPSSVLFIEVPAVLPNHPRLCCAVLVKLCGCIINTCRPCACVQVMSDVPEHMRQVFAQSELTDCRRGASVANLRVNVCVCVCDIAVRASRLVWLGKGGNPPLGLCPTIVYLLLLGNVSVGVGCTLLSWMSGVCAYAGQGGVEPNSLVNDFLLNMCVRPHPVDAVSDYLSLILSQVSVCPDAHSRGRYGRWCWRQCCSALMHAKQNFVQ